jgi:hypothetical protein
MIWPVNRMTPMRKRTLWVVGSLLASAGLSLGQEPMLLGSPTCGAPADCRLMPCAGDPAGADIWVKGEYLLWRLRDAPLPVPIASIVNGQAAVPLALPNPGALGADGTRVLSPNTLDAGSFSPAPTGLPSFAKSAPVVHSNASGVE